VLAGLGALDGSAARRSWIGVESCRSKHAGMVPSSGRTGSYPIEPRTRGERRIMQDAVLDMPQAGQLVRVRGQQRVVAAIEQSSLASLTTARLRLARARRRSSSPGRRQPGLTLLAPRSVTWRAFPG
jgi:hypothetical protein